MTYKLLYTKSAFHDIQKLDVIVKKKIKKKLEEYAQNPFKYSRKLVNLAIGSYRFRIGHYRVAFDIDNNKIIILRIRHRREVYK